jgi:class 3 adenylate cyclase
MARNKTIEKLIQSAEVLASDSADVYLLFADLVGSTEYKYRLISQGHPDIIWISRQLVFLSRSADIIKTYNGIVVKTIGDEIFAYFEATIDPFNIINCGIEIIQAFDNLKSYKGKSKIEAKISIDYGETYNGSISKNILYDPIGISVDRCARLNSISKKNEIIFSDEFLNTLVFKKNIGEIRSKYGFISEEQDLKGLGNVRYHKICAQ